MYHVTPEQFVALLKRHGSSALMAWLDRIDLRRLLRGSGSYGVHDGNIEKSGKWNPESEHLLVLGTITSQSVSSVSPSSSSDEGGSLWVLGDLTCKHFANSYGKAVFIDGSMAVSGIAVNAFEDASLVVTGDLQAKFYYGSDIWVEVGGDISLEYGLGYALPLGYRNAGEQAVYPSHDKEASMTLLKLRGRREADSLVERINRDEDFFGTT
jgi:hypothetical protein